MPNIMILGISAHDHTLCTDKEDSDRLFSLCNGTIAMVTGREPVGL